MEKKPIFDPTISWGDVGMAVVLLLSGTAAFYSQQEEIAIHATEIKHNGDAIAVVSTELKDHKVDSLKADNELKRELKEELQGINSKLDRIIDRELDKAATVEK